MKRDEELGRAAGMDAYLFKPIQPEGLDYVVEVQATLSRKSATVLDNQEDKPVVS